MNRYLKQHLLLFVVLLGGMHFAAAQVDEEFSSALDSARAKEDNRQDSVVFTAKYVRYTTLDMLKQSTRTTQIDTTHVNFQYYNKQNLPWNPTISLGSYCLSSRYLLFNPHYRLGSYP